jgi:hypothetical protein
MVQSEHLRHDTDIQYRAAGKRPIGREMRHGKRRTAVSELRRYTGKYAMQKHSTEGTIFNKFWGVERGGVVLGQQLTSTDTDYIGPHGCLVMSFYLWQKRLKKGGCAYG